jgi:hypothetical protein
MFRKPCPLCRTLVLAICVLMAAPVLAAESAGRVLISAGQVIAIRGGRSLPLVTGAMIEVGDRISTGPESTAQLRFTDASIISLKPQTEFLVNEYSFNGSEDGSEKVLFSLLRGGLRTVTGLIGHLHKANYGVQTPSATIGIRGTVWGATHCVESECKNPDGTSAKPGTYGEVKSGVIAVSNHAPEVEFGANTAFYVADQNSAPTRLLVAPEFVTAQLPTRTLNGSTSSSGGAAAGANAGSAGSAGLAGGASSTAAAITLANTDDGRSTPILSTSLPVVYVASNNTTAAGTPTILAPTISGVTAFFSVYTVGVNGADTVDSCNGGGGCSGDGVSSFAFNGPQVISWSSDAGPQALIRTAPLASNSQLINLGAAGEILIGQLVGPYSGVTTAGAAFNGPGGFIYLATNSSLVGSNASLPASGSFTFGAPGPFIGLAADSAGNSGTVSQFTAAFNAGTRVVSFSSVITFPSIAGFGSATFTTASTGSITGSDNFRGGELAAVCAGAGCEGPVASGTWDARFLHTAATIPAMAVSGALFNATKNGGSGNSLVFVGAGKCTSGGC